MYLFALLIIAAHAAGAIAAGPRCCTRYALLDARDLQQGKRDVRKPLPNGNVQLITPRMEMVPPTVMALQPQFENPFWFTLGGPDVARQLMEGGPSSALWRDTAYSYSAGGKSTVQTGLWDVTAGLHADLRLGNLFFEHDEQASVRIIPIHTTTTRGPNMQPGFVIGVGTTW